MFHRVFALIAVYLGITLNSQGQPGAVDYTFDPGSATDGEVHAIVQQADGRILMGGSFTVAESGVRGRIARLHPDGTLDTSFGGGLTGANGTVRSVVLQSDGKVLIGGEFTNINDVARSGIARLDVGGSVDTTFGTESSGIRGRVYDTSSSLILPTVRAMAVQSNGKIVVGGSFTNINGVARRNIARLNSDGSLDSGFAAQASGGVYAVAVQSDGKILIAGKFSTVNEETRHSMARLNEDGSLDTNFLNDVPHVLNGYVYSLALQSDGKILMGGDFNKLDSLQSVTRNRIARLNSDGSLDRGFGAGLAGANGAVRSVVFYSTGKILIGGDFSMVNGVACAYITRLAADGSLDTSFQNGAATLGYRLSVAALQSDGKILVGGGFDTAGGVSRYRIARFDSDGSLDVSFGTRRQGVDGFVQFLRRQADGKVLIGGYFASVGGVSRNSIARLNADGSVDRSFGEEFPRVTNGIVRAIAPQADGKLLIGGNFGEVNGTARYGIARVHRDGSLDTNFTAALSGTGEWIHSIIVESSGKIIIAGHFGWVNNIVRPSIARLNGNGSLDGSFGSANGLTGGGVRSAAVQPDGALVIGGDFYEVDGIARNYIARLRSNGRLDTGFGAGQAGAIIRSMR